MDDLITPVILSGGAGTRLWPLSTPARPKQLLPLTGPRTLLAETALRVADPARFRAPLVVASASHADAVEADLAAAGCAPATLILEPVGRNTAAAIALAAHAADRPDRLLLVLPSDHHIDDPAAFAAAIARARRAAQDGWLVTFGIQPTAPETGYGYIRIGETIADGVRRVERFKEKPDRAAAAAMLAEGGHFWNAGIFLFRADRLLAMLAQHAPAIAGSVRGAMDAATRSAARIAPDAAAFATAPAEPIDCAVMEKADRVAVVPVAMAWSDVGSWDALWDLGPQDEAGNTVAGHAIALDTRNCLLRGDGVRVAACGVEDLIVVAVPGEVLVLRRGHAQDVRRIVAALSPAD